MHKPQYILTEQEYNDLINQSSNVFQEQRIIELETELDKYKIYKRSMELDGAQLAQAVTKPNNITYPFEVQDNVLSVSSTENFVTLFNTLAHEHLAAQLKQVDSAVYTYLQNLCNRFGYTNCSTAPTEVKRYRVSLQKQELYKPTKVKGVVQLTAI